MHSGGAENEGVFSGQGIWVRKSPVETGGGQIISQLGWEFRTEPRASLTLADTPGC